MRVQRKACKTCIYNKDSPLDLQKLEDDVRDDRMDTHFKGYRVCHHSKDACCRGFYNKHGDRCTPIQLSDRLGLTQFVEDDIYENTTGK